MFITNSYNPTLQLRFIRPLSGLVRAGKVAINILTELELREQFGKKLRGKKAKYWTMRRLGRFQPSLVIFCRYNGPHVEQVTNQLRAMKIPSVFHIDDDLLNVPRELGQRKFEAHNHPERLHAIRYLLENSDLVHCPNPELVNRFRAYGFDNEFLASTQPCGAEIRVPATVKPTLKIGYMGYDHAHDFEIALPALVDVLREFPQVRFDLFGPIPKPAVLDEFGERISIIAPINDYEEFMNKLASLDWDIGICPLAKTDFNAVKTHIKWVEYSSVGAGVIATRGTIYDLCCDDDCGILVDGNAEWKAALQSLIKDASLRAAMVKRAQARVVSDYSIESMRGQIFNLIHFSSDLAGKSKKYAF